MRSTGIPTPISGSYRIPTLETGEVSDAMHVGVHAVDAEVSLRQVARLMSTHHVHALVVTWADGRKWGLVTGVDIVAAAKEDPDLCTAGQIAATDAPSIRPGAPLEQAARMMTEHGVSHLVVADPGERPAGIISSLDLAGVIAWARG